MLEGDAQADTAMFKCEPMAIEILYSLSQIKLHPRSLVSLDEIKYTWTIAHQYLSNIALVYYITRT